MSVRRQFQLEKSLRRALEKLDTREFYRAYIRQTAADILTRFQFLPKDVSLSASTDLGNAYGVVVPDGCAIEAVGYYESDGTLKVSHSIYAALSARDRAAFILHEAIYKLARDIGFAKDSADSRQLNASLFALGVDQASVVARAKEVIFLSTEKGRDWDRKAILLRSSGDHLFRFDFSPNDLSPYSVQLLSKNQQRPEVDGVGPSHLEVTAACESIVAMPKTFIGVGQSIAVKVSDERGALGTFELNNYTSPNGVQLLLACPNALLAFPPL